MRLRAVRCGSPLAWGAVVALALAHGPVRGEDDGGVLAKGPDPAQAAEPKAEKKKEAEGAQLTVVVRGDGKPIDQAEVQVKFPPAVGGESKLFTRSTGEVAIKSPALGKVKVRVIATGWESVLQEVELRERSQRVTIELKAKTGPATGGDGKNAPAGVPR